jgi:hypothetical protein
MRIGCIDFAIPVIRKSKCLDLASERLNVFLGGDAGMGSGLDRVLFGGQAEGVPADRVQDVEASHALVAGNHVADRVDPDVPHMDAAGGVREHLQAVVLRLVRAFHRAKSIRFFPVFLRVALDRDPQPSGCMPSVDPMMESLGSAYGKSGIGVMLSGMGRDGLEGCRRLVAAVGAVMAQDRKSAVVWGMPRAVAEEGLASAILPPADLAARIGARQAEAA